MTVKNNPASFNPELDSGKEQEAIPGTCCACGYKGTYETICLVKEDGVHCDHWWDGADEDYDDLGNYIGTVH